MESVSGMKALVHGFRGCSHGCREGVVRKVQLTAARVNGQAGHITGWGGAASKENLLEPGGV